MNFSLPFHRGGLILAFATLATLGGAKLHGEQLPAGTVGAAWLYIPPNGLGEVETLTGAVLPYTACNVVSGVLPPGFRLSLSAFNGINYCYFSGTPTQAGDYSFSVEVTDSRGVTSAPGIRMITINPPIVISTSSIPNVELSSAYPSTTLAATGGTAPFIWSVISGSLPPGLKLNDSTGVLSGTPSTAGIFTFTVQEQDLQLAIGTRELTIVVSAPLGIIPLPDAMVGVPYSINVGQGISQIPAGGQFEVSAGASLPPGLTVSASGLLSGTPTQAGNYSFSLTFQGTSQSGTFQASLNVAASTGQAVTVHPDTMDFSLTQGSTQVVTQSIVIANNGSSAQGLTVTATTAPASAGDWLTTSPATGSVAPFTNGFVPVSVDPSRLKSGTFSGTVTVALSPLNQQFDVGVLVTVSDGHTQLQLSQSGLRFQTVAGGGAPATQSITLLNDGSGPLNFSVSTSTTSGGQEWLKVSPPSGSITPSSSATLVASIQSGLNRGDYYGQIKVSADGAINSPQTASVVVNVAAAGTDLGAFVSPTGLIFVGQGGGAAPTPQAVSLTNPSPSALTFSAVSFFGQTDSWFTVQPANGMVSAANPVQIMVQPVAGLAAGIYQGEIVLHFDEDNTSRRIAVLAIVVPGAATRTGQAATASTCTPSKLLPVFTQLGANFATVAAWPTPIEVTIVDDCGNFLTAGSVTASFSDSDPSLSLASLKDGRWSATWQPRASAAQVVITVDASELAPPLQGTQSIGGALQANPTTPSINAGGVVSAAKSGKQSTARAGRIHLHLRSASERRTESGAVAAARHTTRRHASGPRRSAASIAVRSRWASERRDPL